MNDIERKRIDAERAAKYRAEHPEETRATGARFRAKHRPTLHAKNKDYRRTHAAQISERMARWRKANPDKRNEHEGRRRAAQAGAKNVEVIDRRGIFERDAGRCHICGRKCSPKSFTLDHLVPLAKGGDHTHKNLAVAHMRCNSSRGAGRIAAQLLLYGVPA